MTLKRASTLNIGDTIVYRGEYVTYQGPGEIPGWVVVHNCSLDCPAYGRAVMIEELSEVR